MKKEVYVNVLHPDLQRLLQAKTQEEPDRANVKYRKIRKVRVTRFGSVYGRRRTNRPLAREYWSVLRKSNRNVSECAHCGCNGELQVHHVDGNPWNNRISNLVVLCCTCHSNLHFGENCENEFGDVFFE